MRRRGPRHARSSSRSRAGRCRSPATRRGFDLSFEALGAPAELDGGDAAARARRHGRLRAAAAASRGTVTRRRPADRDRLPRPARPPVGRAGLGPDRARPHALAPGSATDLGVTLAARAPGRRRQPRPTRRVGRDVLERRRPRAAIAEPRLSTTYDGDGRQRRAGLELWVADETAIRAAPRARSSAARRSTSAGCGWTARSSAGAWTAARASAATTSCAAHERRSAALVVATSAAC